MSRIVQRLNDALGAAHGRNAFGESIYAWTRADEMYRPARIEGKYRMVDQPSSLVTLEPMYEMVQTCPHLAGRWVLAKWCDAGTPEAWAEQFGSELPWPQRGYRIDTNVFLGHGEEPTLQVTNEAIAALNRHREMTYQDHLEHTQNALARSERNKRAQMRDRIGDLCTAFGNKPGARSGGVSLPSAEFRKQAEFLKESATHGA